MGGKCETVRPSAGKGKESKIILFGQGIIMPRTLTSLFEESVERFPDRVLLWEKKGPRYEGITYARMRETAQRFAAG